MSALRLNAPDRPAVFIDLGPDRHVPLRGAGMRGHLCVPEPADYRADRDAGIRVKRFRARHGINGKQRVAT